MKPICRTCGDTYSSRRQAAGYTLCLPCGEDSARAERRSWCVIQEYGKGGYQFVTKSAATRTLRETNQKHTRS